MRVRTFLRGEQIQRPLEHPKLDAVMVLKEMSAESDRAESLHDEISRLEQERDRLKAEGVTALSGCWIETGVVDGRQFRQAWWRSEQAMFPSKRVPGEWVKTCYIGAEGGVEHKEAIAARDRRNRLKWVDRRLNKLMEKL